MNILCQYIYVPGCTYALPLMHAHIVSEDSSYMGNKIHYIYNTVLFLLSLIFHLAIQSLFNHH